MEKEILQLFSNLTEHDRDIQYESYEELMKIMQEPVDWTYAVWEQLIKHLHTIMVILVHVLHKFYVL